MRSGQEHPAERAHADGSGAAGRHDLVERTLAMDGTCSGEHGVGLGKMKFLEAEHGLAALHVMRTIKQALDPLNLMNPGKILSGIGDRGSGIGHGQ